MEQFYPIISAAIAAFGTWSISRMQEKEKADRLDQEHVHRIVDERMADLKKERDRAYAEIIRLRERMAVLEAQARENERIRMAAIARLQSENDELRKINDQLAIELRKLSAQVKR